MTSRLVIEARAGLLTALAVSVLLCAEPPAEARMARQVALGDLAATAGRIVRGRCVGAEAGVVQLAGAQLSVTTYTFDVGDPLKGAGTGPLVFRQVGTRDGGPRDLGARVGLPVYTPGAEYVLFLLPEGRLGLTSPAGAGDGAFLVQGERVTSVNGTVRLESPTTAGARTAAAAGGERSLSYESFRQLVRDLVTP